MLQTASAETKKTTARGSSKPQPAPEGRLAPPVPVLGNQAALRLMRKCNCGGAPDCDCDLSDHRKKEKDSPQTALHRAALSPRTPREAPPIVHQTLRSVGHTLAPETQAFFEARFGQGLGHVRVHTDTRASESARRQRVGLYRGPRHCLCLRTVCPTRQRSRRLLAHELAHVVQRPNAAGTPERASGPSEPLEQNADQIAIQVMGAPARASPPVKAMTRTMPSEWPNDLHRR